ncbi:MFS transporter [Pyrobaculum neutrophilum]|uniref:Major facilitator superfamily MFS_1 n=1 Tax=Pyrobaculum neutrophilum (strain DSM 2338 / JCM 9278 / NBRC 100436 / V24Sta) TaxID=444157 RepID=B1YAR1_PYRNV|nr:MFS transporter [Pyrobaculum neutrophilum]ACB39140.1 major facilitator superfamily MFS_1 [Pyrobaculum neutrophilum V24Sta]
MRLTASYVPIFVARVGSGASAFLVVKLASGSSLEAGVVLAAYPFLEALGALVAGRWSDTLGRKKTLVAGYVVRSAAMLLLALAFYMHNSPALVGFLYGVIGLTTAFILTASLTMATDLTEVKNRGVGMGGFELVNLGSYGVGYLVGSALYTMLKGPAAYLAVALFTAMATPVFAKFLEETRPAAPTGGRFLLSVLPPSAVVLLPVWFALTTIIGLGVFAPRVLQVGQGVGGVGEKIVGRLGESLAVGLLFVGALALLGAGALFFGRLVDRWGRLKTFRLGLAGGFAALLVLNIALHVGLGPLEAIAITAPLLFLTSAIGPSILALIGDEADVRYRGTTMGIYSVVLGLGIGIGSLIGGAVATVSQQYAINGIAAAALAVYAAMAALHIALARTNGLREAALSGPR